MCIKILPAQNKVGIPLKLSGISGGIRWYEGGIKVMFRALEVIPKSTDIKDALEKIARELPNSICGNHLIIIDQYFLSFGGYETAAENAMRALTDWMTKYKIKDFLLYGRRNSTLETVLQNMCGDKIPCRFENEVKDSHDRFWFLSADYHDYQIVNPGTSFNGFGKKHSVVTHLSEKDVKEILQIFDFIPQIK